LQRYTSEPNPHVVVLKSVSKNISDKLKQILFGVLDHADTRRSIKFHIPISPYIWGKSFVLKSEPTEWILPNFSEAVQLQDYLVDQVASPVAADIIA
jgi:hypothetical protein